MAKARAELAVRQQRGEYFDVAAHWAAQVVVMNSGKLYQAVGELHRLADQVLPWYGEGETRPDMAARYAVQAHVEMVAWWMVRQGLADDAFDLFMAPYESGSVGGSDPR